MTNLNRLETAKSIRKSVRAIWFQKYENFAFHFSKTFTKEEVLNLYSPFLNLAQSIWVCRMAAPWAQPYAWIDILEKQYAEKKEAVFDLPKAAACSAEFAGFWHGKERWMTQEPLPELEKPPHLWFKLNRCWDVMIEISVDDFLQNMGHLINIHQHDSAFPTRSNNKSVEYPWVKRKVNGAIKKGSTNLFLTTPTAEQFLVRGAVESVLKAWEKLTEYEEKLYLDTDGLKLWEPASGETIEDAVNRINK